MAPSLMRLVAGAIVLLVLENIILGFPGLSQTIPSSSITISSLVVFLIGFVASVIIFKYGTELSRTAGDTFNGFKNYEEILAWMFEIAALYIFYITSKALVTASNIFKGLPWAYPMILVVIGLIPTIKVVVNSIHMVECSQRHN